jgi:hypothetical protein
MSEKEEERKKRRRKTVIPGHVSRGVQSLDKSAGH